MSETVEIGSMEKISTLKIYTDALSSEKVMGEYLTSQLKMNISLSSTSSGRYSIPK